MRFLLILAAGFSLWAQSPGTRIVSGRRYPRLVVRNAIIIEGNGTPASGPKDIVIENGRIAEIAALDPVAIARGAGKRPQGEVEIDAAGKYVVAGLIDAHDILSRVVDLHFALRPLTSAANVMPGLIDAHAHVQEERGGIPQPLDYELKMWLSCGI